MNASSTQPQESIVFYINGVRHQVGSAQAFLNLAEYLRVQLAQAGTKVVCAEGDCGACTVMVAHGNDPMPRFTTVNSCILPVFKLHGSSVVTIEGLADQAGKLNSVQQAMVDNHGAQCGYCTPGICMSMTLLAERAYANQQKTVSEKQARNFLTGNLCRCTGYEPILKAATELEPQNHTSLSFRYLTPDILKDLRGLLRRDVEILANDLAGSMKVTIPASLSSLAKILGSGRLISGATDLGVQRNKGRLALSHFIALQNMAELKSMQDLGELLEIGSLATWCEVQDFLRHDFPEFSRSLDIFASPQIKHLGTWAGNIINASPIADGVPFLLVNEAELVLVDSEMQKRTVSILNFFKGYKQIDLKSNEMLFAVRLKKNKLKQRVYKVSQRKDLDIATVNMAIAYELKGNCLSEIKIAVGGVAATAIRLFEFEKYCIGKDPRRDLVAIKAKLGELLNKDNTESLIRPLTDVRGSGEYRRLLVKNLIVKWLTEISVEPPRDKSQNLPENPL